VLDLGLASTTPCSRGKHEFIIDDQIGIRCKYCSLVNLEIRFVLPSMVSFVFPQNFSLLSTMK
jgi:DNA repair and recombination RAD54-like protein